MKKLSKKIVYFLTAVWYAFVFHWITVVIFNSVNHDVLQATIINTGVIIFFVITDKLETSLSVKLRKKDENDKPGILRRLVLLYVTGASFKTALYLFYFVMLICYAILAADPDFPVLYAFKEYFQTVYHGILILFAADSFLKGLLADVDEVHIKKAAEEEAKDE